MREASFLFSNEVNEAWKRANLAAAMRKSDARVTKTAFYFSACEQLCSTDKKLRPFTHTCVRYQNFEETPPQRIQTALWGAQQPFFILYNICWERTFVRVTHLGICKQARQIYVRPSLWCFSSLDGKKLETRDEHMSLHSCILWLIKQLFVCKLCGTSNTNKM